MCNENILSTIYYYMQGDGYIPRTKEMKEKRNDLCNIIDNLCDDKRISNEEYNEIALKINEALDVYEMNGIINGINLTIKFRDIIKEQGL